MDDKFLKQLGEPTIQLSGLQIWTHGRQFPDMNDYWDGNWLRVTVHCGAQGSSVWASGAFIHLPELYAWHKSAVEMYKTLKGHANLECMEPELSIKMKACSLGHMKMEVEITPNHLEQEHKYYFEIDQTYLAKLIKQCDSVLKAYPIRGSNEHKT